MIDWNNTRKIKYNNCFLFSCDICKKEKYLPNCVLVKKKYPYCHDCYQKSPERTEVAIRIAIARTEPKESVTCICGKIFEVTKSQKGTTNFCSQPCRRQRVLFICKTCKIPQELTISRANRRMYEYCEACYNKSPERLLVAQKTVKNRRSFDGENNPNFKGQISITCGACKCIFKVSKHRENTAKFCSYSCAAAKRPHAVKTCEYKNIFFRSSWEMKFAQYLDSKNIEWKYEPDSFETSHGRYTPDFWIPDWDSFVEVKGYFRKDAQEKFEEFATNHKIILADKRYLKTLKVL